MWFSAFRVQSGYPSSVSKSSAKPGPRLTPAKRRQIEAAEAWRKSHAGCSLHNACMRSFVPAKGGYKSAKVLYEYLRLQLDSKESSKN